MIKPGMYIGDRYEINDKVGSGGMADVFKALDHKLNRYVAIKILKQEFSTDESFVDKFRAEAQAAAGLSHPNIVNIYDVGEENGIYYIVMELIEGITLKSFIERKGRLEAREAIGIAIQIAQGLETAHANNIIHRDIKPQNIIISKEGKVKVADFGIAKATSSNTLTSSAMGSVHYISPEQARGGYSDEKSDIYSLGITIYEMISGRVPFEGDNAVSIALLHIQEEPRTLGSILPDVPISVDKMVQKCLQKKPERRYLSDAELIDDLKHSLIEPDVDFVVIPDVLNNSPTIALSPDDVNVIRNGALQAELNEANAMMQANNMNNMQHHMDYNNGYPNYNNNMQDDFGDSAAMSNNNQYDDNYMDEDEEKVDNKLEKVTIIGAVIIIILIIGIIAFVIVDNISGGSKKKTEGGAINTSAPISQKGSSEEFLIDVTDMKEEEAIEKLKEKGFNNIKVVYFDVEDVEEGYVFNQHPLVADSRISTSTEITLNVKKTGAQKVDNSEKAVIPDSIIGKSDQEAATEIQKLFKDWSQLKIEFNYLEDPSKSVPNDKVYKTSPAIGSTIKNNDRVVIFVNQESTTAQVPDLIGKTKSKAEELLRAQGLELDPNIEYSDGNESVNVNEVYEQKPGKGSKVSKGTKVKIKIRKEKEVVVVKNNYKVSVTLKGSTDDNPLSAPGEDGNDTTARLVATISINGKTYSASNTHTIRYSTYDVNSYTFEFDIRDYEGDLTSVPVSAVTYTLYGSTDKGISASEVNTSVSVTKQ